MTEIQPAGEQPGLHDDLATKVPDAALRDLLRYEVGAQLVNDKITNAALAETPEQARIAIISVDGAFTDDPVAAEGEVDYSEIVFAPNDDMEVAPELPEDDAAWEAARVEAQAAFDRAERPYRGRGSRREVPADGHRQQRLADQPGWRRGRLHHAQHSCPGQFGDALFDTPHNKGDLIGPIRGETGYYVLLFNERRDSPRAARNQTVQDLLASRRRLRADRQGPLRGHRGGRRRRSGWVTRDQLATDLVDKIFALTPGQLSEPIELSSDTLLLHQALEEKAKRPLDPDQVRACCATPGLHQLRSSAKA